MDDRKCNIVLRPLRPEDCDLLFGWRNDPWIVSLSASQQTVSMSEHQAWFSGALVRDDMLIQIISDAHGQDMGLVRVTRENEIEATITVYLMQPFIGKKRGPQAIRQACALAFTQWPSLQTIDAWIRRENSRSMAVFSHIGFRESLIPAAMDFEMIRMCLERTDFLT